MKNNEQVITLDYESGLASFLDEMSYSYFHTGNLDESIQLHIKCSKVPTFKDVWNLYKEFSEWKQKNNI
jgi:hypothetical protein